MQREQSYYNGLQEVQRLILESRQPLPKIMLEDISPGTAVCTQMHSHHNLDMIFLNLWRQRLATRGSFLDLVFRIILFHRSLEGNDLSLNTVDLSREERKQFCDDKLFELIKLPMIAVNQAYHVLGFDQKYKDEERTKYLLSIETRISEWRSDWKGGYKNRVVSEMNRQYTQQVETTNHLRKQVHRDTTKDKERSLTRTQTPPPLKSSN